MKKMRTKKMKRTFVWKMKWMDDHELNCELLEYVNH